MDGRPSPYIPNGDVHPSVRINVIAVTDSGPALGVGGLSQNSREIIEAMASRLEPLLRELSQQNQHRSAPEGRATVAILHWQSGQWEQVFALLEPTSIPVKAEGSTFDQVKAGTALIPLVHQTAILGFDPQGSGGPPVMPVMARRPTSSVAETQPAALAEPLSERELEVLRLLSAGLSNKELAAQLFLSVGTVKQHLHHINGKLGTTSRTSAMARARHLDIL